ncbi:MAG: outer membrane lipoprotein-sorting protein, partial [Myxococcota bacterium]
MTILFLSAFANLASAETASAAPTLESLLAGLKTTYSETEAIQADFTQVTRSESFGEGPEQTGQLILGRPRMMRIAFEGEAG